MKLDLKKLNQKYIRTYRLIWCILAWTPLVIMIVLSLLQFSFIVFSTFTFQSNLFVASWLTLNVIYYEKKIDLKILHPAVHGAITLYISVTFLIFAILLAPFYIPTGIYIFTNLMVHYVIPIAMIFEWLITEIERKCEWIYLPYWLIYPIGYLIYSLILGGVFNIYIYPFFDMTKISIAGLIIAIIGLTLFFILLGALYIFLNRKIYKKYKK
ncbi:MAG: Pr6Pr family membrane protein [Candidatus Thorarchaeota archaeon]